MQLTFDMLAPYDRKTLQKIISDSGLKLTRLARRKQEEMITFLLENQESIEELPPRPDSESGTARRRGRKPQYSQECQDIVNKSSAENKALAADPGESVIYKEPVIGQTEFEGGSFAAEEKSEGRASGRNVRSAENGGENRQQPGNRRRGRAPKGTPAEQSEGNDASVRVPEQRRERQPRGERQRGGRRSEQAAAEASGVPYIGKMTSYSADPETSDDSIQAVRYDDEPVQSRSEQQVPRMRFSVAQQEQAGVRTRNLGRRPDLRGFDRSAERSANIDRSALEASGKMMTDEMADLYPSVQSLRNGKYYRSMRGYDRSIGYQADPSDYDRVPYEEFEDLRMPQEEEEEAENYVPVVNGILDIRSDKNSCYLRGLSYKISAFDVHVSPGIIKRFALRAGDLVCGTVMPSKNEEGMYDLEKVLFVNGMSPEASRHRPMFDQMVPIFPNEQYVLETKEADMTARVVDMFAPVGKGQRALIVSPPKAGKTICLKKIAAGIAANFPDSVLMALLVDERPEEVTDMARSIKGEVIASTFDEDPKLHVQISSLVLERAKRMVELGKDVVILLDSLTRLGRACNNATPNSGRTMSGGLDITALRMPKRFFGAARKMEHGGSLTIIATALIDTGSRMDEVIFEEFKGTGNNEIQLSRKLAERRFYPAIDLKKSGTRHDECLQSKGVLETITMLRRHLDSRAGEREPMEIMLESLKKYPSNAEFMAVLNGKRAKTGQGNE